MIVGLFPELLGFGGVQRACRHTAAVVAAYAAQRRMRCCFLSLNDTDGPQRAGVGQTGFDFRGLSRGKGRLVVAGLRLALAQPRLVLAAHPNLGPLVWAMKAASPALRTVVMAYGCDVWDRLPAPRRWALRRADLVIAPSMDTLSHLVTAQGVSPERIRNVPLGLDPEFGRPDAGHRFPAGKVLLTVGRQEVSDRDKGVDLLIHVMPRLVASIPDLHLVVVGDGADRPRLERTAQDIGVNGRIHFLGHVSAETLAAAYRRCDVFALPSKKEGFGLVHLEAMAFGKPVVGGAHGATPEIIEDGVSGHLVAHGDLDRLTAVLQSLLTDGAVREAMGRRAQERVRDAYLFDHFRARMTALLDEAL